MVKPRAHAFYSPSSAYIWMECAPAVLTDLGDFDDSSDVSDRGTFLHHCGEQMLRDGSWSAKSAEIATGIKYAVQLDDGDSVKTYVDYIASRPGALRLEVKSWFIRGLCGGITDAVLFDEDTQTMEVVDYKAGFVQRRARGNYQLIIYALGCLKQYAALYPIKRVKLTIVQPMHMDDEPDSWSLSVDELENWALRIRARIETLEELRKESFDLSEDYNPSKERCQFCSVGKAMKCAEQERAARAIATEDFEHYQRSIGPPHEAALLQSLTDTEKWDLADQADAWIKNFRDSVTSRVLGGTPVEGFKTVEGKGKRHVHDKPGLVAALVKEGFRETDIYVGEPKLVSPNQAEKLYKGKGSKAKKDALAPYFRSEAGAPQVVPESDPRPATSAESEAVKDFANYKREES